MSALPLSQAVYILDICKYIVSIFSYSANISLEERAKPSENIVFLCKRLFYGPGWV